MGFGGGVFGFLKFSGCVNFGLLGLDSPMLFRFGGLWVLSWSLVHFGGLRLLIWMVAAFG